VTLILDCEAERIGQGNLNVIFNINHDLATQEKKYFLLPNDRAAFVNLINEIYDGGENIIPALFNGQRGKKAFKEKFIDYTLNQNYRLVNVGAINKRYEALFDQESYTEADLDQLAAIVEEQKKSQLAFLAQRKAAAQKRLEEYTEAQANVPNEYPPNNYSDSIDPLEQPRRKPADKKNRPVQEKNLSTIQQAQIERLPPQTAGSLDGINGDRLIEDVPVPMLYPGDKLVSGESNAGLQVSRDEIYRFKGHTSCGSCYLYAGKSTAAGISETDSSSDLDVQLRTPNNLKEDAAYVYLSQKSDSKTLLGVVGGTYKKVAGDRRPQSLAAIKADDVVLMSRESGIRLITGTNATNSRGGEVAAHYGIDLIAGNNDRDLQPLVKGDNLAKYLKSLSAALDNLASVVYQHITAQGVFNAQMASHRHYDPFTILLGTMGNGNPTAVLGGQNLPSQGAAMGGAKVLLEGLQQMQGSISQAFNRINNDFNALEKVGSYSILSEKNRTN
tara:strand:+ start:11483 stop:12985 length:1503 start_codon:yes stop_codon:yes gene_type:complete